MAKHLEVSIPQIARFVKPEVYDQVIEFHTKTNYATMRGLRSRCYLSSASSNELAELEFSELSVWPGINHVSPLKANRSEENSKLLRQESGLPFSDQCGISFSAVDQLLIDSFCSRSKQNRKRPYPSGGALYTIEVFLCRLSENIHDWPSESNIFHLLPLRKGLEAIHSAPIDTLLDGTSGGETQRLGTPYFALVYAIFFERAIFKYKYRGYRLALMEAGSMYQMADLCGKSFMLRNRVWAGFSDYHVAKILSIDPRHMAPLAIQFFGHMEDGDDAPY